MFAGTTGHLSVVGTTLHILCVFIQGVDVVKEVNLDKRHIGLTQITNLNEKKINCKSLWSGYTFGGNSVRSMHGVGKGFSWEKVSLREESLESIFTSATASPSAGASAGTSAIIAPLQSSCLSKNKEKVIYELRTRVLDELLKWAYIPSQLKPPSASDLRNLGPYRHQHLSPVNDQAALKPFFFNSNFFFSCASDL